NSSAKSPWTGTNGSHLKTRSRSSRARSAFIEERSGFPGARRAPRGYGGRSESPIQSIRDVLRRERGLERLPALDLLLAAELVGDLLPGRRRTIERVLGRELAEQRLLDVLVEDVVVLHRALDEDHRRRHLCVLQMDLEHLLRPRLDHTRVGEMRPHVWIPDGGRSANRAAPTLPCSSGTGRASRPPRDASNSSRRRADCRSPGASDGPISRSRRSREPDSTCSCRRSSTFPGARPQWRWTDRS